MRFLFKALVFSIIFAVPLLAQINIFYEDFEDGNSDGWVEYLYGDWDVVMDEGDYSYVQLLPEIEDDNDLPLQAISVVDGLVVDEFQLQCLMKSGEDQLLEVKSDFSFVFAFQDTLNYYKAFFNQSGSVSVISKYEAGIQTIIASHPTPLVTDNQYHKITLVNVDSLLQVILDDSLSFIVEDFYAPPGQVGVGVFDDVAYFDEFAVYEPYDALNVNTYRGSYEGFPEVQLCVNVTEMLGRPIQGLDSTNFDVTENGFPVDSLRLELASGSQWPLSVAMLLDISDSMDGTPLDSAKTAISTFLDNMTDEDKAALVSFASGVTVDQSMTSTLALVDSALTDLTAGGATAMYDGLIAAMNQVLTQATRRAIILLTDGAENASIFKDLDYILTAALASDVPIYTIGLNSPTLDADTLQYIAAQTGGAYYFAPGPEDLLEIYLDLVDQFYNQYCLTFISPDTSLDCSERTVNVEVTVGSDVDSDEWTYTAPCSTDLIPIYPYYSSDQVAAGDAFWLDIFVGRSYITVTDLFGVSFNLTFEDTSNVAVGEPYSTTIENGSFMGNDVVFLSDVGDTSVTIGNVIESPNPGVDGYGSVARVYFEVPLNATPGDTITFSISNVSAINSAASPLNLQPETFKVAILEPDLTVWPGDADNDGAVDGADVLPLGLYFGSTGPSRAGAPSYTWMAQECPLGWATLPMCYADCDGNGIIDAADVFAIGLNFGQSHSLFKKNQVEKTNGTAAFPTLTLNDTTLTDKHCLQVNVHDVNALFGISFSVIVSNIAEYVEFDSVLITDLMGDNIISYTQIDSIQHMYNISISQKAGADGVAGHGTLCEIYYHILDGAPSTGDITFEFLHVTANDPYGIGYVSVGHMDDTVAPIALNQVAPTIENIIQEKYKVTRGLYSNTKGEPKGLIRKFIEYLFIPEGHKIIEENGFIPVQP